MRRVRRLRLVAAVLIVIGIVLILAGEDRATVQALLVVGLAYGVVALILERRSRR